jgi:hypothetical protein
MVSSVKITPLELEQRKQKKQAAGSPEEKTASQEKPEELKETLRQEQASYVLQEWLSQVNGRLKVKLYLDKWEGRGEGA